MDFLKSKTGISVLILIGIFVFGFLVLGVFGGTRINITLNVNPSVEDGLVAHFTFEGTYMDLSSTTAEVIDRSPSALTGDLVTGETAQIEASVFYFTNDTATGMTPAGKESDFDADNDTEFTLGFSATNTDLYWYTIDLPAGSEDSDIDAGAYTQHIYFDGYTSPPSGALGITSATSAASIPRGIGKDKAIPYAATFYNSTGSSIDVTQVLFDPVNGSMDISGKGIVAGFPTSGTWDDGGINGLEWTGTETVGARSATTFWATAAQNKITASGVINVRIVAGGTNYDDNVYITEGVNGNANNTSLYMNTDSNTNSPEYEVSPTGGIDTRFYIVLSERDGKASVNTGGTLTINVPSDFTNVTCIDGQTGWTSDCVVSNNTITTTNSSSLQLNNLQYYFNATPPMTDTDSLYNLYVTFDGTDGTYVSEPRLNAPISVAAVADNLVFNVEVGVYGSTTVADIGETQSTIYASLSRPFGKDKPTLGHAITFFNASSTERSVTAASFTTSFSGAWDVLGTQAYPAIGDWSLTGSTDVSWSGTDVVPPRTARAYWVEIDPDGKNNPGVIPITASLTADGVTYTDSSYTTESTSGNSADPVLYFSGASYVESATAGEETTYTLIIFEDSQKAGINSGASLYIDIPSDFTSADCVASQTDWTNKSCTNTLISASTTAAIALNGSLSYQFKATAPSNSTTTLYKLHANLVGTDGGTNAVDSHFNGAISIVGAASTTELIATTSSQTIIVASSSPLQATTNSTGPAFTFPVGEVHKIQTRLQYVSGGGYVNVKYNDNDTNPTRLVTPGLDCGGDGCPEGAAGNKVLVVGKIGQGMEFDGIDDYVTVGNAGSGIKSVSFWVKISTTTANQKIINIDGTDQIETNGSSAVTATSFPAATIYIDNVAATTLSTGWHHVVITDTSGVNASTFELGRVGTTYFGGTLDDVRLYNKVLSADDIGRLFGTGATTYFNTTITTNPDLENGLVGHWTMDGPDTDWGSTTAEILDRSGSNNTGDSNFTASNSTVGKIGQAIDFDGSGDYIEVSDANSLDIASNLTLAAWIYPRTLGQGNNGRIFDKGPGATDGYIFLLSASNGFAVQVNGVTAGVESNSGVITLNAWNHVVGVVDSSGTGVTLYRDGELVGSGTLSTSIAANSENMRLGLRADGNRAFDGHMDDMRIYNRALSASDVLRLYGLGATTKINKTITTNPDLERGLIGHWTFDGPDLENNASDRSATGNDGFLSGFSATTTRIGKIGQSLEFNGTDEYVLIGSEPAIGSGSLTIASWVYVDTISNNVLGQGFLRSTTGDNIGDFIMSLRDDGNIYFFNWRSSGADADGRTDTTTAPISTGEWYHVTATWDGTTNLIYIDGVSQATTQSSTVSGWGTGHEVGRSFTTSDLFHDGKLDDVRIYNRALSPAEILRLYQLGN